MAYGKWDKAESIMSQRNPPQRQRGPDFEGAYAGADTKQRMANGLWLMAKSKWKMAKWESKKMENILDYDYTTLKISSQVGCPLNCAFCATGMSGYVRNLTSGEILSQILGMEISENEKINNVVFMGMGEPMLNYDEVIKAIHVITDPRAFKISQRRVSISTAGVIDGILKLSKEPLDVILSISLHAPTDDKRSMIMPINRKYNLENLMESVKIYQKAKDRRVTFEYILFDKFNDSLDDARKLVELLKDIKCNVNLIRYNDTDSGFKKTPMDRAEVFAKFLKDSGIEAVIRAEKGEDIAAACGQLRRQTL